jgi:hypothetical protein
VTIRRRNVHPSGGELLTLVRILSWQRASPVENPRQMTWALRCDVHDDEYRSRQVYGQVCQYRRYRFDAPCQCAEDNDISLGQRDRVLCNGNRILRPFGTQPAADGFVPASSARF